MPSEVSIAKALSGSECLEACMYRLREVLRKDDRFSDHMAYMGFQARIRFEFLPQMSFIPVVDREVIVTEGETTALEELPTVVETVDIPVRPPNQVREEAEMKQPVLVTDGEGKSTEKWVKRGRPPKFGGAPRNKVVGGK